jgi:hypothetical protein
MRRCLPRGVGCAGDIQAGAALAVTAGSRRLRLAPSCHVRGGTSPSVAVAVMVVERVDATDDVEVDRDQLSLMLVP